jgi:hypothetical protein
MRSGALLLWSCIMSCTPTPYTLAAETESTVFELSGTGTRNTRPFDVKHHWEIRWKTNEAGFTVLLYQADAKESLSTLPISTASQPKPGSGSTYIDQGGRFYLGISSKGDWTITVVQLP